MLNDERGSLRSRGAAAVSSLTLRQIAAVIPSEPAWGVWLSRQIIARVMDTFGPPLAGTHVTPVDAMRHIACFIAHALRDNQKDKAAG